MARKGSKFLSFLRMTRVSPGPAGRSNAGDLVKAPPANTLLRAAERKKERLKNRRKR